MLVQKVFQINSVYSVLIKKANYAIDFEMEEQHKESFWLF